jgi:hypothetical protein
MPISKYALKKQLHLACTQMEDVLQTSPELIERAFCDYLAKLSPQRQPLTLHERRAIKYAWIRRALPTKATGAAISQPAPAAPQTRPGRD